ncbi:MAG: nucleotide sugar dehydrogenase [Actinomycetota bacterium]|nr:nucleotide sugar dehydrogenase [Actinomycetota bacterium]
MLEETLRKLDDGTWEAAVVGLGYVGLPLLVTMARKGVSVMGFDVKPDVVASLSRGRSHIDDIGDADLAEVSARTRFTSDPSELSQADVIFICVPTPLAVGKLPDNSYIERAARDIASAMRPGQIVILESTTSPGTTDNTVLPILGSTGFAVDEDFLLAYSPERVDPGNASHRTADIPRVVGGVTPASTAAVEKIYARFVPSVHAVSNARTAETAKLLENTFRWVNIALANEMAMIARALGVDIWEVVDAAATKPFGYMPFYPGPGVGGHCIPLDPYYLQWAARMTGEGTRFIELAEWINTRMPSVVVDRVQEALNESARSLRESKVLILGVAYKPNISDYRESPALEVIELLRRQGAEISYADPHVRALPEEDLTAVEPTTGAIADADCVLILADHDAFDYESIVKNARVVVDTRNAIGKRGIRSSNVRTL